MAAMSKEMAELLPTDEDLLYEEELLRNPYSLKLWWRYLEARKEAPTKRRYLLYERALKSLPGSYKVNLGRLPSPTYTMQPLAPTAPPVPAASARLWRPSAVNMRGWRTHSVLLRLPFCIPSLHSASYGTPTCRSVFRPCAGSPSLTRLWRPSTTPLSGPWSACTRCRGSG